MLSGWNSSPPIYTIAGFPHEALIPSGSKIGLRSRIEEFDCEALSPIYPYFSLVVVDLIVRERGVGKGAKSAVLYIFQSLLLALYSYGIGNVAIRAPPSGSIQVQLLLQCRCRRSRGPFRITIFYVRNRYYSPLRGSTLHI